MKTNLILFLILSALSHLAWANFSAEVFELKSARKKILFNCQNVTADKEGFTESKSTYTDPAGAVALEESAQMKGSTLVRYEMDQRQMGVKASVEVKDDQVLFEKTENGKTKKDSESLRKPLVISSTFWAFVKEHWSEITAGKTVGFRYASWERMETVGFEIKKSGEEVQDGHPVVIVKMAASSFVIAAIVDPLYFTYSADGAQMISMKGRVAPKQKIDSSWKDLDAEVVYHY